MNEKDLLNDIELVVRVEKEILKTMPLSKQEKRLFLKGNKYLGRSTIHRFRNKSLFELIAVDSFGSLLDYISGKVSREYDKECD